MEATISLVYLLNRRYRPFYKWMHRGVRELPILGRSCHESLAELCAEPARPGDAVYALREQRIEEFAALIIARLREERLSGSDSDFLLDHAHAIQKNIENQALRSLPVMME
jgi:hypothetical protein